MLPQKTMGQGRWVDAPKDADSMGSALETAWLALGGPLLSIHLVMD